MKFTGYATRFSPENGDVITRAIDVPPEDVAGCDTLVDLLDLIYKFGQNDFQHRDCPSISTGDVVLIETYEGLEESGILGSRMSFRCLRFGWAFQDSFDISVRGFATEAPQDGERAVDQEVLS